MVEGIHRRRYPGGHQRRRVESEDARQGEGPKLPGVGHGPATVAETGGTELGAQGVLHLAAGLLDGAAQAGGDRARLHLHGVGNCSNMDSGQVGHRSRTFIGRHQKDRAKTTVKGWQVPPGSSRVQAVGPVVSGLDGVTHPQLRWPALVLSPPICTPRRHPKESSIKADRGAQRRCMHFVREVKVQTRSRLRGHYIGSALEILLKIGTHISF